MLRVQSIPHRGYDLGHLSETSVGVLPLDGRLRVPEEQRVRRHWPGETPKMDIV